jgi:hypothetical protein
LRVATTKNIPLSVKENPFLTELEYEAVASEQAATEFKLRATNPPEDWIGRRNVEYFQAKSGA